MDVRGRHNIASRPKVKTGCHTCRIRKVKCDEQRPSCKRCTSTGRNCDGYPLAIRNSHRVTSERTLIPRDSSTATSQGFDLSIVSSLRSYDERRYVNAFNVDSSALAGPFKSTFWSYIVPQAAQHEAAISHSLAAIMGLIKTSEGNPFPIQNSRGSEHYKFALLQYNKAVVILRKYIDEGKALRIALIACILFACIEVLHGNQKSAMQQLMNGRSLLPLTRTLCGLGNPRTSVATVEKEIFLEFVYANSQARTLMFQAPVLGSNYTSDERRMMFPPVPTRFLSLEAAKEHIDLILDGISTLRQKFLSRRIAADVISRETASLSKDLVDWRLAIRTLLQKIPPKEDTLAHTAGSHLLLLHFNTANLLMKAIEDNTEMCYDASIEDFEAIIQHARIVTKTRISNSPCNQRRFSFEVALLPPLIIVATKCRVLRNRLEAIELMQRNQMQEGLWDGFSGALICQWITDIEEQGRNSDGNIPSRARVRLSDMDCNLDLRYIRAECTSVLPNEHGKYRVQMFRHSW